MVASRDVANSNVGVVDCHVLEIAATLHNLGPLRLELGDLVLRWEDALIRQKFLH